MKKILLIILCLVLVACNTPAEYQSITPETAYERLASEDVLLLDVRTESEYLGGHIPDSVLYPNETIDESFTDVYPDKDRVIFVYCRSGNRSKQATNKLIDLGYTNVFDLGGIIDWPYEIN